MPQIEWVGAMLRMVLGRVRKYSGMAPMQEGVKRTSKTGFSRVTDMWVRAGMRRVPVGPRAWRKARMTVSGPPGTWPRELRDEWTRTGPAGLRPLSSSWRLMVLMACWLVMRLRGGGRRGRQRW